MVTSIMGWLHQSGDGCINQGVATSIRGWLHQSWAGYTNHGMATSIMGWLHQSWGGYINQGMATSIRGLLKPQPSDIKITMWCLHSLTLNLSSRSRSDMAFGTLMKMRWFFSSSRGSRIDPSRRLLAIST